MEKSSSQTRISRTIECSPWSRCNGWTDESGEFDNFFLTTFFTLILIWGQKWRLFKLVGEGGKLDIRKNSILYRKFYSKTLNGVQKSAIGEFNGTTGLLHRRYVEENICQVNMGTLDKIIQMPGFRGTVPIQLNHRDQKWVRKIFDTGPTVTQAGSRQRDEYSPSGLQGIDCKPISIPSRTPSWAKV